MDTLLSPEPSSYKQLFKQSFLLYWRSFTHVILLSFLLSITAFVPRFLATIIGQDLFLNVPFFSLHRFWLVAVDIVCLIFLIGIIWRMHCTIQQRHERMIEDVMMGIRKVFYVFIASLLQSAILFIFTSGLYGLHLWLRMYQIGFHWQQWNMVLIGVLLIGQAFLILYLNTLFIFLTPIIAVENKGIFSALQRSVYLVWNHWWRVFSVQITPWLAYLLALIFLRYILNVDIHIYFVEQSHHTIAADLLHVVIFALFMPWVAAVLLIQLKDLERRKHIAA